MKFFSILVHDCMDFGGRLKYHWKFVLANKDPKSHDLIFDSWSTSLFWSKKFVQVVSVVMVKQN